MGIFKIEMVKNMNKTSQLSIFFPHISIQSQWGAGACLQVNFRGDYSHCPQNITKYIWNIHSYLAALATSR